MQKVSDEVMGDLEPVTPDSLRPHASPCRAIVKIKRHLGPEGKRENIILRWGVGEPLLLPRTKNVT